MNRIIAGFVYVTLLLSQVYAQSAGDVYGNRIFHANADFSQSTMQAPRIVSLLPTVCSQLWEQVLLTANSTPMLYFNTNASPPSCTWSSTLTVPTTSLTIGNGTNGATLKVDPVSPNLNRILLQPVETNRASGLVLQPNGTATSAVMDLWNSNDQTLGSLFRMDIGVNYAEIRIYQPATTHQITSLQIGENTTNIGNALADTGFWYGGVNRFGIHKNGGLTIGSGTYVPGTLFNIATPTSAGEGTVAVTATGTNVTGTGTTFRSTFWIGDQIVANGETHTISAIASDTSLTTDAWTNAATGVAYTTAYPVDSGLKWSILQNGSLQTGTAQTIRNYIAIAPTLTNSGGFRAVIISPVVNNPNSGAAVMGVSSTPAVSATTTAITAQTAALSGILSVSSTNTQNWTAVGLTEPVGVRSTFSTTGGATGTITVADSMNGSLNLNATGLTITSGYILHGLGYAGAPGRATSLAHIALAAAAGTTNTSYVLLGTDTIPTGNFAINDQSGYDSTLSGNLTVKGGTNILYRCTTAGTLPVGATTIATGNCGASVDTGLRVN